MLQTEFCGNPSSICQMRTLKRLAPLVAASVDGPQMAPIRHANQATVRNKQLNSTRRAAIRQSPLMGLVNHSGIWFALASLKSERDALKTLFETDPKVQLRGQIFLV